MDLVLVHVTCETMGIILWQHISQLFYQDTDSGLKLLPKLTYDHIHLNSYL